MSQQPRRDIAVATVLALLVAGCGSSAPSATPLPRAASFEQYAVAACAAWDSLFRAVGNPDTASGSVLSKSLDDAVTARDAAMAERLAPTIITELETGRQQAAVAGGWQPAGPTMAQMDRVFLAFEAMIQAKRAAARDGPGGLAPQTAFEQAGGVEAWQAMFEAYRTIPRPSGAAQQQCGNLPVGP